LKVHVHHHDFGAGLLRQRQRKIESDGGDAYAPFRWHKNQRLPQSFLLIGPAGVSTSKRIAHGLRKEWLDQKIARARLHGSAHQGGIAPAGGGHHGHGGFVPAHVLDYMDGLLDIVVQIHNEHLAAQLCDGGQLVPRRIGPELVNQRSELGSGQRRYQRPAPRGIRHD
jgi:hypothetical protein